VDINGKLRPLYLLQILQERTDEEHSLTTTELCDILREEYGIDNTFRTTIKSDVEVLRRAGYSIQETRQKRNHYSYLGREFELPELKLLIDAVLSSKAISRRKGDALAKKLMKLAGPCGTEKLKRNLVAEGRVKTDNEQTMLIIDGINEAINAGKKIRFRMVDYNRSKRKVLHNDGESYVFSPYSLVWDGDCYYVVGYSDKYQAIGSHRVDRIYQRPEILAEDEVPAPRGFRVERYINTMFRMFDAPRREVQLIADNRVMGAIVDKFGTGVRTEIYDADHVCLTAEVAVGTVFFNWVFGFRGLVKIQGPEDVREEYRNRLKEAEENI